MSPDLYALVSGISSTARSAPETSGHSDGTISCPPVFLDERAGTLANPTVVFEILSPNTEFYDRKTKFQDYATLPSVREIVLIETDKPRVEVTNAAKKAGSCAPTSRAPPPTSPPSPSTSP